MCQATKDRVGGGLEYLLVPQFHRQVVLNMKAKNFQRAAAEYIQVCGALGSSMCRPELYSQ